MKKSRVMKKIVTRFEQKAKLVTPPSIRYLTFLFKTSLSLVLFLFYLAAQSFEFLANFSAMSLDKGDVDNMLEICHRMVYFK